MTNISVQILGTSNLSQPKKEFAELSAQVATLNAQLATMIDTSKKVDASGYQRLAKAAAYNSKIFREGAASTGLFDVQQRSLNSATDEYIKKLKAQKLSFRELMQTRKLAHAAYREQLAMENMLVKRAPASTVNNRETFDVITPRRYAEELDTAGRRLSMMNEQLKSGANQMVNWGKNTQWAGRQLMVGFTMPLVAFGAAAGVMAYQLDKEMTRVRKVYDTTADSTSGSMEDIAAVNKELAMVTKQSTATALQAAKDYGQAATDTISVQAELAATGKTGVELQKDTLEVMRIARLGEVDYQVATQATIALQSIFRMSNQELSESFNYMNAVENATSLSTADFAEAIPVAASAVKAWGGDIKELGILLTAMKENGIGASEGANAIKATMQRLARPSKQVREEWEALTGVDIMDITENADGLVDVFTQINAVTQNLSDSDKRKAFAGLFGSYQVSRMMALTKGMGELQDGIGQVSDAYRLSGQDAEEWRQIAENELTQYRKSISGQFQTALQSLKIQLASFGEPFVEAATTALNAVTGLMKMFQGMPDIFKWILSRGLVVAALAGPVIMLTGLLANLAGNGLKVFAAMLTAFGKFGTSMNIMSQEGRIWAKITDLQTTEYVQQTTAVRNLTLEIEKLTAAQTAANATSAQAVAAGATAGIRKSKALQAQEKRIAEHQRVVAHMNQTYGTLGTNGRISYFADDAKTRSNTAGRISGADAELRARRDIARIDQQIAASSRATSYSTQQTRRNLTGAAVSGGALAAGMALTMATSNETANEIGKWLIIGSLVVPATVQLVKVMASGLVHLRMALLLEKASLGITKVRTAALTVYYTLHLSLTKAMLAYNAAAAAGSGIIGRMGAGMAALMNPMTWIIAGVAAVGIGIYAWQKHLEKVRQEQADLHNNINEMATAWAEKMGLVRTEYEKIAAVQQTIGSGSGAAEDYQKYLDQYQSGDMKKYRESFASSEIGTEERTRMAADHLATLVREYGMTVAEASRATQALYEASGMSLFDAQAAIDQFKSEFGTAVSGSEQMVVQARIMFDKEDFTDEAHVAATDFGRSFGQALSQADPGAESAALVKQFTDTLNETWTAALNQMDQAGPLAEKFKELGIDTGDELRQAVEAAGGNTGDLVAQWFPDEARDSPMFIGLVDRLNNELRPAIEQTTYAMGGLTGPNSPFAYLPSDINSLTDLAKSMEYVQFAAQSVGTEDFNKFLEVLAKPLPSAAVQSMLPGMNELEQTIYGAGDATDRLNKFNALLASRGYDKVNSEAEMLLFITGKLPGRIKDSERAARGLAAAFSLSAEQAASVFREAAEGVQGNAQDMYTDWADAGFDKRLQASQNYWDGRVDQVANAGDRARDALDAAWERKNAAFDKYWDNRIDAVDKAIKAEEKAEEKREKMFDAEVARIEKLNDLANANIDFNVALNEGKLDEAAKLRNDMQSAADVEAIERARGQMGNASERRIDKLNNKKDSLEKQREKAQEQMQRQEEAQKAHLDRMTKAQQEAVEKQRDIAIQAKEDEIAADKLALEAQIENLMSGTAKNAAELRKRFKDAGLNYDDFYRDVIKPTGKTWGQYFGDMLHEKMRNSYEEIKNDNMWEELGKSSVAQIARGMGFSGERALMHFLETGEIKDFAEGKPPKAGPKENPGGYGNGPGYHTGGEIGVDKGGRKGIAKNYKGQHPSEMLVNAQKGEFMVNRDAAQKNKGLLQQINDGRYTPDKGKGGGRGTKGVAGQGLFSFYAAAFGRAVAGRTANALGAAAQTKKDQQAAAIASFASGSPYFGGLGHYSLPGVKPWVLEAANYLGGKYGIGSIGGVGERSSNPTSDHPKGLALDFMTGSAVDKGWALANEALRLQKVLDATYMIFQAKIHSFDSRGWQPYSHPSGATDPTSMHMDHVHLSFSPTGHAGDLPKPAAPGTGGTFGPGIAPGPGGLARASVPGKGWGNSHDYNNGRQSPIFAFADGTVTSRTFPPGAGSGEHPDAYPKGYGSYGVQAIMRANNGTVVTASHLWPGTVKTGPVKAGEQVALSASTGNSSGYHTHFEVNGSTNAQGMFAAMGIPLQKGAAEVMFDNTLANLHKGEAVLTRDLNQKFHQGVERFANGGDGDYTFNVHPSQGMDEEKLARKTIRLWKKEMGRGPVSRTVGVPR